MQLSCIVSTHSPLPFNDQVGIFCFAQSPVDKLAAPAPTVQATHSTESMPPAGQPVSELLRYLSQVSLSIFHWHDVSRSLTPIFIAMPDANQYGGGLFSQSSGSQSRLLLPPGAVLRVEHSNEDTRDSVPAGDEESVREGIAAVAGRAGRPTDDTDGGFEEDRIGDVTVRIAFARGVLRVAGFIASRRDRVSCWRFHGRKDGGQGSATTDAGRRFEARKTGTCGR